VRIVAAASLVCSLLAFPALASAHVRFRLTPGTLAPGANAVLTGAGLRPGATVRARLQIAGRTIAVGAGRASRSGRLRLVIQDTPAIAAAAATVVGDAPADVLVRGQRLALHVRGTILDPMALAVVPDGPVGYDDDLTLQARGIVRSGPAVAVRFLDCLGGSHTVAVPRPAKPGPEPIVLMAHTGPRRAVDTTCFADLALEYAPIDFTVGEIVGGAFHAVATTTASFLPPTGF
jgi:hypothetical protein